MSIIKKFMFEVLDPQIAVGSNAITQVSASDIWVRQAIIVAPNSNTGILYLADTSAKITSGNCIDILGGQSLALNIDSGLIETDRMYVNLSNVWVQKTVPADKVVIMYVRQIGVQYSQRTTVTL